MRETLQYYGHCSATKWQEYCNTITLQRGNIATRKYCNAEILQYNNIATQQTVQHYCNVYCNTLSEHMSLCCNKRCNWHCNTTSPQTVQQYITVTTTFYCNKSTAMAPLTSLYYCYPTCLSHYTVFRWLCYSYLWCCWSEPCKEYVFSITKP